MTRITTTAPALGANTLSANIGANISANKRRAMIAILLSLLLHAAAAGSASVIYWRQKAQPLPTPASLSLLLPDTSAYAANHSPLKSDDSPLSESPSQTVPVTINTVPAATTAPTAEKPSTTAAQSVATATADQNPTLQSTTEPSRTPIPPDNRQTLSQLSAQPADLPSNASIIDTESMTEAARASGEPIPQNKTGVSTENIDHSRIMRTASVLEHMMIQNLVRNPGVTDSTINIREATPGETESTHLVSLSENTLPTAMQLPRQTVRLETVIDGQPVFSHAQIKEKAFSAYAHFIDRWDNDVFLSDDQIIGDFHVNSRIKLADSGNSQPRIHGRFSIGVTQLLTREFQNEQAFLQGVESGVGIIPMERDPLLQIMADITPNDTLIHYFHQHTELTFHPDGSVHWRSLEDESSSGLIAASTIPQLLINESRHRFELSGVIKGHYLVYSPQLLLITGPLSYASETSGTSSTPPALLGLVSGRSVEIAARSTTGNGDLRIDAAIYAARRFSVRRFDDRYQGNLHIFGSLAAGSISATEPRFTTLIEKDPRLDEIRPPGFPLTGQTLLADWDGRWYRQQD